MIIVRQKEFNSKAQKALRRKLETEGTEPGNNLRYLTGIEQGVGAQKTALKTGKDEWELLEKIREKNPLSEATKVHEYRKHNKKSHDPLADKTTESGMKSYKNLRNYNAERLRFDKDMKAIEEEQRVFEEAMRAKERAREIKENAAKRHSERSLGHELSIKAKAAYRKNPKAIKGTAIAGGTLAVGGAAAVAANKIRKKKNKDKDNK